MIPLRSSERTYSPPIVTLGLIAVNIAVFLYEISLPNPPYPYYRTAAGTLNGFIAHYGMVPDPHYFRLYTVFTSMFLHGGWMHVLGNMWFLWIFGKSVEDLIGHYRFLLFYLLCGVAAGFAQVYMTLQFGDPAVPTIGASGAIAGVMGAYLVRFPRARIITLIFVFIFITTVDIPAAFLLLYWFAIQFFSGVGSIGESQVAHGDVAFFAHVGGFLAGMGIILLMPTRRRFPRWY